MFLVFFFLISNSDQSTVCCTQNEDYTFNSFSKEPCPAVVLGKNVHIHSLNFLTMYKIIVQKDESSTKQNARLLM